MARTAHTLVLALVAFSCAAPALGQGRRLSMAEYTEKLEGFWLGGVIANWTGLRTEGLRNNPPFFTDDDWGKDFGKGPVVFVTDLDPWIADDDTDIEYVYVHLMHALDSIQLTDEEIVAGWKQHINHHIWVSNKLARNKMGQGVRPPMTGSGGVNKHGLMIDAQLTTEVFGAVAPGMPGMALRLADLPVRTTSYGYATHAAQFFVLLHAFAIDIDPTAPLAPQIVDWVERAREFVPDTSKSADIVDFVLAEYAAAVDVDDWELARDRVHVRYQKEAAQNGFIYRNWFESSVNFATALIALLFGEGDYQRSVQIATLSGWDSDNPAATIGGLLGLVHGASGVRTAFPGEPLADRYTIDVTRDNMPDWLPNDPEAEDTLTALAARMVPMVSEAVVLAGGQVDEPAGIWILPDPPSGPASDLSPTTELYRRSANNAWRLRGGVVTAVSSIPGHGSSGSGEADPRRYADGFEADFAGFEPAATIDGVYSTRVSNPPTEQSIAVMYDMPSTQFEVAEPGTLVHTLRFTEGYHEGDGGWFESIAPQVWLDGAWIAPPGGYTVSDVLDEDRPFQQIDFVFERPVRTRGVRVIGTAGGSARFVTALELDALGAPKN